MKFRSTGNNKGFNIHFDNTNEKLKIQLHNNNTGTATDAMIIDNSGKVGIGITAPEGVLEVKNNVRETGFGTDSWNPTLIVNGGNPNAGTNSSSIFLNTCSSPAGLSKMFYGWNIQGNGTAANHNNFSIKQIYAQMTAPETRFHIDFEGNVGIGTTSPIGKLQVAESTVLGDLDVVFSAAADANCRLVLQRNHGTETAVAGGNNTIIGDTFYPDWCIENFKGDGSAHPLFEDVGLRFQSKYRTYPAPGVETTKDVLFLHYQGNVGIGITTPIVPLHVYNNHAQWSSFPTKADGGTFDGDGTFIAEPTHGDGGYWVSNSTDEGTYNHGIYLQDYNVWFEPDGSRPSLDSRDLNVANKTSIYCEGSIIVGGRVYLESDERVKNRIRVIDDNIGLDVIRKIECYSYFYNNSTTRDVNISYGFLAQQVKQHIPNAVKFKKDFLPEAMCFAENIVWEDLSDNTYKLTIPIIHKDNSDNIINYTPGTKFKFFLTDNSSNIFFNQNNMIISTLMDDQKSFIFKKKAEFVFIYGYEVEDFHVLDKEKIFTVHHSAIQEIDRIQQEEKTKLEATEIKLAAAEAEITTLKTQLAAVLARLDALESN